MIITPKTKISELIKENSESVVAISSLAKPLEKLRNPLLRKIMASRVTIAEAARMGGTTVEEFRRVLQPLGFTFREEDETESGSENHGAPSWLLNAPADHIQTYDVRPIIDEGADPLKEILHRFKTVPPGHILCLVNSFVPTPLIHLLQQEKAEASFVREESPNEIHTFFLKKSGTQKVEAAADANQKVHMDDLAVFEQTCARISEKVELDVRHLEMPGPMHAILAALEELPADTALYIHHKRVPVYLLEELADKDYEIHLHTLIDGEVKMLIFRK